jgi:hypothetical protein
MKKATTSIPSNYNPSVHNKAPNFLRANQLQASNNLKFKPTSFLIEVHNNDKNE